MSPCDLPQVSPNLQINNSFRHQTGGGTPTAGDAASVFHQMIHGHRRHSPPSASRASMSSGSRRTTTHARPRRQPPPQRPPHTAPPPELLAATAAATAAATTTVILGRNSLTSATNPRSVTSGHFLPIDRFPWRRRHPKRQSTARGPRDLRSTTLTSRSWARTRNAALASAFLGQLVWWANGVVKQSVRSCQSSLHLDSSRSDHGVIAEPRQMQLMRHHDGPSRAIWGCLPAIRSVCARTPLTPSTPAPGGTPRSPRRGRSGPR